MTNRFVRSSKFRHVFGKPDKRENCYDNIKLSKNPNDSSMSSVNNKFIAVALETQGGGAFLVAPVTKTGRFDINYPKVSGHKEAVLDLMWNPFDDNQIASASQDCTIKIWNIPGEGLTSNMTEPVQTLVGHVKKVHMICWHPCASDILLSLGYDNAIIIWNTLTGEKINDVFLANDLIYSVSFNYNGSHIAATCKDKHLRVINVRTGEVTSDVEKCHDGTKPTRVVFCGKRNLLFTTGFSRMSDRQYGLWNANDLSKILKMENIDNGSGVLMPFFDIGTDMVYIVGKGDTAIKYFEITDKEAFYLSMYQSTKPQRGACVLPRRDVDYMKCEVMRFYKVQPAMFEPVSMTVPRKSEMFQDDIFPPCFSSLPALSAEEWISGTNCDPKLASFNKSAPHGVTEITEPDPDPYVDIGVGEVKKSKPTSPATLEEYKKAYQELLAENKKLKEELEKKN